MSTHEIQAFRGEGCGNAYLFVDGCSPLDGVALDDALVESIAHAAPRDVPAWLAANGDPTLDGVILLTRDEAGADRRAIVWNADGSRGEVCGNGLRAAALHLRERFGLERGTLASDGGRHAFAFESDGRVAVALGAPRFDAASIGIDPAFVADDERDPALAPPRVELELRDGSRVAGHAVSVGNPHLVLVHDAPVVGELHAARELESHPAFARRVNVSHVWPLAPGRLGQRTFERGSSETDACGSGACAAAVVARHLGLCGTRVTLVQPGGELEVRFDDAGLTLVGPATVAPTAALRVDAPSASHH